MRTILSTFAAAAALCVVVTTSRAASIAVQNYNFSSPLVTANGGYYQAGTPTGWSETGFGDEYFENAANGGFASGTPGNLSNIQPGLSGPNYQYIAADGQGTVYQNLGVAFQPYTTYTVDISGGHRSGFDGNMTTFGLVSSNTTITGTGPSTLLATAGSINEGALATGTFNWASAIGSPDAQTFTFTTGVVAPSGDLEVYINSTGTGRLELGGVEVTAVQLPEPASLVALVGLGGMGFIVLASRRRRRAG